jgi:tryptophan synthase alpha chain
MNRINKLFQDKKDHILSVYFTSGYPSLHSTVTVIKALQSSGADMVEIGIPFSDPMADGTVIQKSSSKALKNGMSLKRLFEQIKNIRNEVHIPLLLMGYLNPVLQYGIHEFCRDCHSAGIDGIILPDLPPDIYCDEYRKIFEEYDLKNILLITPQTSDERIRFIDSVSSGFIYMVSSSSTTGARDYFSNGQIEYFSRIKNMKLSNPLLAGFGISNHETFETVCRFTQGAIIGSAFVKMIEGLRDADGEIRSFIEGIRK